MRTFACAGRPGFRQLVTGRREAVDRLHHTPRESGYGMAQTEPLLREWEITERERERMAERQTSGLGVHLTWDRRSTHTHIYTLGLVYQTGYVQMCSWIVHRSINTGDLVLMTIQLFGKNAWNLHLFLNSHIRLLVICPVHTVYTSFLCLSFQMCLR